MRHPLRVWRRRQWPGSHLVRALTGSELGLLAGIAQPQVSRVETCIDPIRPELLRIVREIDGDTVAEEIARASREYRASRRERLRAELTAPV